MPGANLDIPLWILGSSLYSAQLAGALGLPYAFAGHFAPEYMLEAIELYRKEFQPSSAWRAPYVMIGVQVIAAESDEEAALLSTSLHQRFLGLIRNQRTVLKPPVENMDTIWTPGEKAAIESKLRYAAVGGEAKVKSQLQALIDLTQADELIINSEPYDNDARLRSFAIIANGVRA